MRENYRYPSAYMDEDDYETHVSASFDNVDLKGSSKWTPLYTVEKDKMIFYNIDTPEKRLAMIKAYESLEKGDSNEQD